MHASDSCRPGGSCDCYPGPSRRDFLRWTGLAATAVAAARWPAIAGPLDTTELIPSDKKLDPAWVRSLRERGVPVRHRGGDLDTIGMPVGGIGAGQLYLGGDGRLWHWDIFNLPQASAFSDTSGPHYATPAKPASPIEQGFLIAARVGGRRRVRVLDRRGFDPGQIGFCGQYPMGLVEYRDPAFPLEVDLEAFSPFVPLSAEDSSLPATVMRYRVRNVGSERLEVTLAGWMENGVCLGSGRAGQGQRRNREVRDPGVVMVHATAESLPPTRRPPERQEIVFDDFEEGYGRWTVDGEAFGSAPASGTLEGQQAVSGFSGRRLVNTFLRGDRTQGRLTSEPFTLERRHIAFLIGGGGHADRTCMNLLVDGLRVRTATGHGEERLEWHDWDVSEWEGRTARLEIVDQATEGWGHINVDRILFTDAPPSARVPLEGREDFGSMALAVLGGGPGTIARTRVDAGDPAAVLEPGEVGDAVEPFGRRLVGAVGRTLEVGPGETAEVTFVVAWHFPGLLRQKLGPLEGLESLRRSYGARFGSAQAVVRHVAGQYERLAGLTRLWRDTWYDSTLPHWFLDRTMAPVCTLATSTCYQFDTGRFYAFEGVYCCQGTCQHVWNYAQSVARLFPELERDLRRRTDFGTAWREDGATDYRGECARHVAHDGQCGVILRAWREHTMSADDTFLRAIWPRVRASVEYLMREDKDGNGLLEGEQYNTLDASWWGPMAWVSSLYVAALRAGEAMAGEVGDRAFEERCRALAVAGSTRLVVDLYNGEYFIHRPDPAHPRATNTNDGCHIDQLMGEAWARQVALPRVVPSAETRSALRAIWRHNFTPDVGPYRTGSRIKGGRWYAMPGEGGVVMTTFPRGGMERATGDGGFGYYFNEVWTGQEHQLAAHLLVEGMVDEGLVITRVIHDRHHPSRRNPYNEVECSDHYTRAMASHGTFLAACGFECHGPRGHVAFAPRWDAHDFRAPFTLPEGWGTFAQRRAEGRQVERLTLRHGRARLVTLGFEVEPGRVRAVEVRLDGGGVGATLEVEDTRARVRLTAPVVFTAGQTLEVTFS